MGNFKAIEDKKVGHLTYFFLTNFQNWSKLSLDTRNPGEDSWVS